MNQEIIIIIIIMVFLGNEELLYTIQHEAINKSAKCNTVVLEV